jgi:hypothetical protein
VPEKFGGLSGGPGLQRHGCSWAVDLAVLSPVTNCNDMHELLREDHTLEGTCDRVTFGFPDLEACSSVQHNDSACHVCKGGVDNGAR